MHYSNPFSSPRIFLAFPACEVGCSANHKQTVSKLRIKFNVQIGNLPNSHHSFSSLSSLPPTFFLFKMRFGFLSLAALAIFSLGVSALPHEVLEVRASDPPYSVSESLLEQSIVCKNGTDAEGGIVFLVHGTGSTGDESCK